jgi:hypothetical protein
MIPPLLVAQGISVDKVLRPHQYVQDPWRHMPVHGHGMDFWEMTNKTHDKVHGNAPDFAEHLSFIMAIWQCTSSPGPLFLGTRAWRHSQAHALSPPIYA